MTNDKPTFLSRLRASRNDDGPLDAALALTLEHFGAESGTIHMMADGLLELRAHSAGLPPPVLETIRRIPVGKGMAGLAAERAAPVTACNLQTDDSGDVRPGAKATGLRGSIVVPIMGPDGPLGTLGIANQAERTFSEEEVELLLEVGRELAHWGTTK